MLTEDIMRTKGLDYYSCLMKMSYIEFVEFLKMKYGEAKCDYFTNETCKVKSKNIARTKEGLFCHHVDEDKAIMLSTTEYAVKNSFDYQKANRLVYCNYLEHLLLHILIIEEPRNPKANLNEIVGIGGAVNFICPELNDMYEGHEPTIQWKINVWNAVKNDYDSYMMMLKRLLKFLNSTGKFEATMSKRKIIYETITGTYDEPRSNEILLSLNYNYKLCCKIYEDLVK